MPEDDQSHLVAAYILYDRVVEPLYLLGSIRLNSNRMYQSVPITETKLIQQIPREFSR